MTTRVAAYLEGGEPRTLEGPSLASAAAHAARVLAREAGMGPPGAVVQRVNIGPNRSTWHFTSGLVVHVARMPPSGASKSYAERTLTRRSIQCYLSAAAYDALNELAKASGETKTALVERAILNESQRRALGDRVGREK